MKTERFELKLSPEDKALIVKAAHIQGQSVGSFFLETATVQAKKIVSKAA